MAVTSRFVITSTRSTAPPPDPKQCCCVTRVAPESPGHAIGLRPGALIIDVHGRPGATFDEQGLLPDTADYTITFWQDGEQVQARLQPVDLGIEICPTPEGAATTIASHEQLLASAKFLWEQGRWADLESVTAKALRQMASFVARIFALGAIPMTNTPALLMHGAALTEQSKPAGKKYLDAYRDRYMASWTTEYHAISAYYEHRAKPDAETLAELSTYCTRFESPRLRAYLAATGTPQNLEVTPNYFPVNYRLPALDGGAPVSLRDTLSRAKPGQVVIICSLANYRGNGPYDDFMRRFMVFASTHKERLLGVHVLTGETQRRSDRPHWYATEDRAVAAGLPVRIALDEGYAVTVALKSTGSPDVLVVDATCAILARGDLTSFEWWAMLAVAGDGHALDSSIS